MKKFRIYLSKNRLPIVLTIVALGALGFLLINRLGSLVGGLSSTELLVARTPVGWHGIYHHPLYLPLNFVRSVVFFSFSNHGQTLTRLPNTLFGVLGIFSFAWLVRTWHGTRTAILATCLFATSAWVLHVSRLASFDVLYLWTMPTLLLIQAGLQRRSEKAVVFYGSVLVWGLLLYIPGVIWLILPSIYWQRKALVGGWKHFKLWWQRLLFVLAGLIWLPLLIVGLTRPGGLRTWLGLPSHLAGPVHLAKQFVGVFVHLFFRGPQYPQVWLARAPILDIFTLVACLIGIYFYATHHQASRSRLLGFYSIIGIILVSLGGPVSLSLLVPILYLAAATGITYLLREWLQVFPLNPFARSLGISIVVVAVGLSCLYNLRAYFVAWPHNSATQITFRQRL